MRVLDGGASAAGRAVLGGFFVLAGASKVLDPTQPLGMMEAAGLPGWLLPAVVALEVGGGVLVASGRPRRWALAAALALVAFTLATNLLFHRFWELDAEPSSVVHRLELSLFFKNLAICGGLFLVVGQLAPSSPSSALSSPRLRTRR